MSMFDLEVYGKDSLAGRVKDFVASLPETRCEEFLELLELTFEAGEAKAQKCGRP